MDKISLPQMVFQACHGVFPWEKETPQPFLVSITLGTDLTAAGNSDVITDTIDYGALYVQIKQIVESNTFNLIEKLAAELAGAILQDKRVQVVTVRVTKEQAQVTAETATPAWVEITRTQSER